MHSNSHVAHVEWTCAKEIKAQRDTPRQGSKRCAVQHAVCMLHLAGCSMHVALCMLPVACCAMQVDIVCMLRHACWHHASQVLLLLLVFVVAKLTIKTAAIFNEKPCKRAILYIKIYSESALSTCVHLLFCWFILLTVWRLQDPGAKRVKIGRSIYFHWF